MPAVPGSVYGQNQQPSCFDRMKTGFTIGFCVGMASGALFGGFSALRYVLLFRDRYLLYCNTQFIELNDFKKRTFGNGE